MGKSFGILRAMVFVVILSLMLAYVPMAFYQGNIVVALFLGIGMFVSSVLIAWVLLFWWKRR